MLTESDLECGASYRSRYIRETYRFLCKGQPHRRKTCTKEGRTARERNGSGCTLWVAAAAASSAAPHTAAEPGSR